MRGSFALLTAAFVLPISASPVERRDSSPSTTSSSSSTTAALLETTISGTPTTVEVFRPTTADAIKPTSPASSEDVSTTTASVASGSTDDPLPASSFPQCKDADASPFCLPEKNSTLYVGETYYVTWNPEFFRRNATIAIILNWKNSTNTQAWSSEYIPNQLGYATVTMKQGWIQPAGMVASNNLTFVAIEYDKSSNDPARSYDGPDIKLTEKPVEHYDPPPPTKAPNKEGLMIGLPAALGFCLLVVVGLFIGMRKHRQIGLGNIMSRSHGYVSRKSRRQRLGHKKGHIRLEDREIYPEHQLRDDIMPASARGYPPAPQIQVSGHGRDNSLSSLVSDGNGQSPRQFGGNVFREEPESQRTGRL